MNTEQRIRVLEEEVKILKNEIKTILLDIREQYLNIQSPFNCAVVLQAESLDKSLVTPFLKQAQGNQPEPGGSATGNQNDDNATTPAQQPETDATKPVDDPDTGCIAVETKVQPNPTISDPIIEEIDTSETYHPIRESMPCKCNGAKLKQEETGTDNTSLAEKADAAKDSDQNGSGKPDLRNRRNGKSDSHVDLAVIAGVAHWVENATSRLGKYRVIALLEVLWAMERLSGELKDLLVRLADMSPYDKPTPTRVSVREYLFHLAQLSELIGDVAPREKAVLSLLSEEDESHNSNEEAPVGQNNGNNPSGDGISGVQCGCLQRGVPGGDGR